jgi:hypothetical protein
LERGGAAAQPRAAAPAAAPASSSSGRSGRSYAELKRDREAGAPAAAPELPTAEPDAPAPEASTAEPASTGDVDIDDVIVAWADILPELPPATRAAVREAQPISVDGGVITFGVPRAQYDVAVPRFKKEADNIRAALSEKLGRRMMFKPVAHDGFDADPVKSAEPRAEISDDEEMHDIADLVDAPAEAPAVDSVSLITQNFGATVVEEVPRD